MVPSYNNYIENTQDSIQAFHDWCATVKVCNNKDINTMLRLADPQINQHRFHTFTGYHFVLQDISLAAAGLYGQINGAADLTRMSSESEGWLDMTILEQHGSLLGSGNSFGQGVAVYSQGDTWRRPFCTVTERRLQKPFRARNIMLQYQFSNSMGMFYFSYRVLYDIADDGEYIISDDDIPFEPIIVTPNALTPYLPSQLYPYEDSHEYAGNFIYQTDLVAPAFVPHEVTKQEALDALSSFNVTLHNPAGDSVTFGTFGALLKEGTLEI